MIFSTSSSSSSPSIFSSLISSTPSAFTRARLRKNKSKSIDSEPSTSQPKTRHTISTEQFIMGQAHGKGPVPVSVDFKPSSRSDIYKPAHTTQYHSSLPPLPEPPHSAPVSFDDYHRTDPFSRGDCTPGGSLARKGFTVKPRHLAKKLSQSRGHQYHTPSKSVGAKMQAFEQMVKDAEERVGIDHNPPAVSRITDTVSVDDKPTLRRSISDDLFFGPKSAPPCQSTTPFPPLTSHASTSIRPSHHRRSSSNSVKSGRASIRSTKRAEREWRAKVAALAHISSPHSSIVELRGPVPPKRTPGTMRDRRSDSPASDTIVTPPPAGNDPAGTPAKSFISNMSFETLGHYHLSPARTAFDAGELSVRDRKASVPRSVVSSFDFDHTVSKVSTRPSSLAASHELGSVPLETASPLRQVSNMERELKHDAGQVIPVKSRLRGESLPPLEQFQLAPVATNPPTRSSPALPESSMKPVVVTNREISGMTSPTHVKSASLPMTGDLKVSIQNASTQYNSVPSRKTNQGMLDNTTYTEAPSSSSKPRGLSKLEDLPVKATPIRSKKVSIPGTPLSPTTAYLLSAPIGSIDMSRLGVTDSPEQKGHPFSLVPVNMDSPPPSPKLRQPMAPQPRNLGEVKDVFEVKRDVPSQRPAVTMPSGVSVPLKIKKRDKESKRYKPAEKERSTVLQVKKTQPKIIALGSDPARAELERQREKLKKMGVDLTPGMDSGNRPPKSGMPMNDLQKWLMHTSLGSE